MDSVRSYVMGDVKDLCKNFVRGTYVDQAYESKNACVREIEHLLRQRKLPKEGWADFQIERLLADFADMDFNNFHECAGIGEREGRVFSKLVQRRHFRFSHGIGRSGNIAEVQPKAAGSSILLQLTNSLTLDAVRLAGISSAAGCVVIPVATGMALVLCMLTLKKQRPGAKYVIWPRIDQMSCIKSINMAGLEAVVIENLLRGDQLETDIDTVESEIQRLGSTSIVCVMSTTSCFAPRAFDRLESIGEICERHNIPHLINNAYGIQASKICHHMVQAARTGRVDLFVQSTDKNFMVPVGGSIVASFKTYLLEQVAMMYPGRASASPVIDLFITLLGMGSSGYMSILKERKENFILLKTKMSELAEAYGERLLQTPDNPVSLAITLDSFTNNGDLAGVTQIGSALYRKQVSGTRILVPGSVKQVAGHTFLNYGQHSDLYPHSYLTASCAVGTKAREIDMFITRLRKILSKARRQPVSERTAAC